MTIDTIIKVRYFFLILGFLGLLIFGQIPMDEKKVVYSIWEIFIVGNILFTTQYFVFSEYGFDDLRERGFKVNYNLYQYIGVLMAFLTSSIVILAVVGCCPA